MKDFPKRQGDKPKPKWNAPGEAKKLGGFKPLKPRPKDSAMKRPKPAKPGPGAAFKPAFKPGQKKPAPGAAFKPVLGKPDAKPFLKPRPKGSVKRRVSAVNQNEKKD